MAGDWRRVRGDRRGGAGLLLPVRHPPRGHADPAEGDLRHILLGRLPQGRHGRYRR